MSDKEVTLEPPKDVTSSVETLAEIPIEENTQDGKKKTEQIQVIPTNNLPVVFSALVLTVFLAAMVCYFWNYEIYCSSREVA